MDSKIEYLFSKIEVINSVANDILKTVNSKHEITVERLDGLEQKLSLLKNITTLRMVKIDEVVRKSANSINVIVRLVAGAQNISSNVLGQILIDAEALTNNVKSTTDINFTDIPNDCVNEDILASHIKDLIIKSGIFHSKSLYTGNPSFDPINTNIPLSSITNSTISQASSTQNTLNQNQCSSSTSSNISNASNDNNIPSTSSMNTVVSQTSSEKNTLYQNQSSSPALSNVSNLSNCTSVPSNSVINSPLPETSSIQNTMYQNQISSTISSNMFNLSSNALNNPLYNIDNSSREREKQEQEALRKKYRNKYKYLDKYKNINKPNSTQEEKNYTEKPHFTENKFTNVNESNSEFLKAFRDCRPYRDPIFDGIEDVELVYIEEGDQDPRRVIKSLSDIQPRVLFDLIDSNSTEITEMQQRLNRESKSRQCSNLSKTSDEINNSNKSNRKNVTISKRIKSDKQKSETIVNAKNIAIKRKSTRINNKSTPPKKRASFRKPC